MVCGSPPMRTSTALCPFAELADLEALHVLFQKTASQVDQQSGNTIGADNRLPRRSMVGATITDVHHALGQQRHHLVDVATGHGIGETAARLVVGFCG